jgi:hypothetical protein
MWHVELVQSIEDHGVVLGIATGRQLLMQWRTLSGQLLSFSVDINHQSVNSAGSEIKSASAVLDER